jgi:excinuclease ABC subunit A
MLSMFIELKGVKQNNLKNIDVKIPLNSFTVVCGPSGSGKSSLAFETLFAEGQRRYIESLSSYARQFLNQAPKPLLDSISNIPPAIALEQKNTVKNSRSTVGTTSEIIEYLRLLYSKLSVAHCPNGHGPIVSDSPTSAADKLIRDWDGKRAYLCVLIKQKEKRYKNNDLLKSFLADGFNRILINKGRSAKTLKMEPMEIGPKTKIKDLPKKDFYIVIDRLAIREEDRGRMVDSLGQCYETAIKYNHQNHGSAQIISTDNEVMKLSDSLACSVCDEVLPSKSPQLFSFNSPVGACDECNGFGNTLDIDESKVIPNPTLSIGEGAIVPFFMPSAARAKRKLMTYCKSKKIDVDKPWEKLPKTQRDHIWEGNSQFYGVRGYFDHLETKKYKMHVRVFLARFKTAFTCPKCHGSRLLQVTNHFLIHGETITTLCDKSLKDLYHFFLDLEMTDYEKELVKDIYEQLVSRLRFLNEIGVYYLTLARQTRTLSGGEFQRLLLAKQLGMGLSQALYVLDEPTIGLHPRDNDQLIKQLKTLNELGNTLVVVEHDQDVIKESNHVIEMGPGSGYKGGSVIFNGNQEDFMKFEGSNTNHYLTKQRKELYSPRPVGLKEYKYFLELKGCTGRNLKNTSVKIPLNRIVTVTGVSGSGKSTLITETLYPALVTECGIDYTRGEPYKKLLGAQNLKNVLHINQSPVGKSARSNPATYLKIYDVIRDIFASTLKARNRGYTPGIFSLNVNGGRCPVCKGLGYELIDMVFMDDIKTICQSCDGKKFQKEILDVTYRGKNIYEVLQMTIAEAMDFFVSYPNIRKPLSVLKQVGLDYLTLGQSTASLSGGESQRIKIARELYKTNQKATLYILDEPTTGLHFKEVQLLMSILHQIVETGGSVVLIEHNLEVMAQSDYIIDLGPEAGVDGGKVIAQGSPLDICKKKTHTAKYLKEYLNL